MSPGSVLILWKMAESDDWGTEFVRTSETTEVFTELLLINWSKIAFKFAKLINGYFFLFLVRLCHP